MQIKIAVDAMGGDNGLLSTVPAAIKFAGFYSDVSLLLVGDTNKMISAFSNKQDLLGTKIELINATQVIAMDDLPTAIRHKKDSSMHVAINLVKSSKADGVISAGNTGALVGISRYILKTIDSIDRPAIAKILPTIDSTVCLLDLGGNTECTPENLLQFGIMGNEFMRAITGREYQRISILNIGTEASKGNQNIKQASELLQASGLNFCGNIEPNNIFNSKADVVISDGFTGNIMLKTIEGVAEMIGVFAKQEFTKNIATKCAGLIAMPVLRSLKNKIDARRYNGAIMLGLNSLLMKSHGCTDSEGFFYALEQMYFAIKNNLITNIKNSINGN